MESWGQKLISQKNGKSKNFLTQNILEICNIIKRPDLRILGIEEGAESHLLGPENIRNKITEHFPNLKEIQPIEQT